MGGDSIAGTVSAKWAKGTGGPSGDECQNLVAGRTSPALTGNPYGDHESREGMLVAHSLRGEGFDASEDGTGRGTPLMPIAFHPTQDPISGDDITHAIGCGSTKGQSNAAVAVALRGREGDSIAELGGEVSNALRSADGGSSKAYVLQWAVRRLTPRECERLQGIPDDYTRIPWARFKKGVRKEKLLRDYQKYRARGGNKRFFELHPSPPDGPRYKAIGNGMAVPCVAWILRRIDNAVRKNV